MSNGFLSQDEINSLLNGELNNDNEVENNEELLSDLEKDLLGEVGNISMGSASTALYQLLNQKVNITTPVVTVTTIKQIKENFDADLVVFDENIDINKNYKYITINNDYDKNIFVTNRVEELDKIMEKYVNDNDDDISDAEIARVM